MGSQFNFLFYPNKTHFLEISLKFYFFLRLYGNVLDNVVHKHSCVVLSTSANLPVTIPMESIFNEHMYFAIYSVLKQSCAV